MSKVITFSRVFPAYHPRKGDPTYFVEKLNKSLPFKEYGIIFSDLIHNDIPFFDIEYFKTCDPKHHTIRAGNRWKVGDKFSPRVWSGKPYASKQMVIAPDIEIKSIWNISILGLTIWVNGKVINSLEYSELAKNDGLTSADLKAWFNKIPFEGQIICWNENIKY